MQKSYLNNLLGKSRIYNKNQNDPGDEPGFVLEGERYESFVPIENRGHGCYLRFFLIFVICLIWKSFMRISFS